MSEFKEKTIETATTEVIDVESVVENIGISVPEPVGAGEVAPLNYEAALASYNEAERQEIIALSDSIDVTEIEKVMNYGSVPLTKTFEDCGRFLKNERGSQADQEVIARVVELSKKASESNEDFNLVLQEPNKFRKFLVKIFFRGNSKSRTEKIQNSAVTCYKLLAELKCSCDLWVDMLKEAMDEVGYSVLSDMETITLLEKYIIAGNMARGRIEDQLKGLEAKHEETGLQKYYQDYEKVKEGYKIFDITLHNLEKSRVMYHLSLGQLALIKTGNRNVQISIHTQVKNTMALVSQQLRNATLNAKTREVLEGQKALSKLSDELIKDVSQSVGLTAEETEKLLYNGIYNVEAAKEAVTTIINSCSSIESIATEMLPQMKADMSQLEGLVDELGPCISRLNNTALNSNTVPSTAGTTTKSTITTNSKLTF